MAPDTVQVIVPVLHGVASDDIFETPLNITSGVYTVPGVWEFAVFEKYQGTIAGASTDSAGWFEADQKWRSTFEQDGSYVVYDEIRYIVDEITSSPAANGIILKLKRKF